MKQASNSAATSVAAFFCTAAMMLLSSFAAQASANLGITPLAVTLPATSLATSLSITNNASKAVTMQAEVQAWKLEDSKDVLTPTRELFVSPPIFRVAAGATQIVRIGRLQKEIAGALEKPYRLVLTEVPPDAQVMPNAIATVLKLTLPLFVPPAKRDAAAVQWTAKRGAGDELTLIAENTTNATVKITEVGLLQDGKAVASREMLFYVLPKSRREFRWVNALKRAKPGQQLEVKAKIARRKYLSQPLETSVVSVVPLQ